MTDREKVIKGLENLSEWLFQQYRVVYDGDAPNYYDAYKTVDEALALLKEQEPIRPILARIGNYDAINDYTCPVCGTDLYHLQKYCDECGRTVKWDG